MSMTPEERHVIIVGELKHKDFLSAKELEAEFQRRIRERGYGTAPCFRTIQRDIQHLRVAFDAPIYYDNQQHGYLLRDQDWVYPIEHLEGDDLFASLLAHRISQKFFAGNLLQSLIEADTVQLSMSEPGEIDADLLSSVIFATGGKTDLNPEIFDTVSEAWRCEKRLRIDYSRAGSVEFTTRDIDIHALFLSGSDWYVRAYCHLRGEFRNFSLTRIRNPEMLAISYQRQTEIAKNIHPENVFDYETYQDIRVRCDAAKAKIIAERTWFPGQCVEELDDGDLRLSFPEAPQPNMLHWILSYSGYLVAESPRELIGEVRRAAQRLLDSHC